MEKTQVTHITYGAGEVCGQEGNTIRVRFSREEVGEKSFVYPDAFARYLHYQDEAAQSAVESELTARRVAEEERERERSAARAAMMQAERERQKAESAARRKAPRRKKVGA